MIIKNANFCWKNNLEVKIADNFLLRRKWIPKRLEKPRGLRQPYRQPICAHVHPPVHPLHHWLFKETGKP